MNSIAQKHPLMARDRAMQVWWISLVVKLILACAMPFSFDEAYYWVWSHHLQLSYYDHPGMVAWLFALGHGLESFANAVRIPFVIVGHLSFLVWLCVLQLLNFSEKQKLMWLALMLSSPILGVGSWLGLPDVPLLLFSAAATYFFIQVLQKNRLQDYLGLGASLGVGFCAKYHIVLVALAIILCVAFGGRWRKLRPLGLLIAGVAGLIGTLPVLIWNAQNHWSSFLFQIDHGLGQTQWKPEWTLNYIGGEILLIFPVILYFAYKARKQESVKALQYLAWFPLGFFLWSSTKGNVELNWPLTAIPVMYALAAAASTRWKPLMWGIVLWGGLTTFVMVHIFFPFLPNPPDKLNEVHYFDPLRPFYAQYSPLYLGSYQMTSIANYEHRSEDKPAFQKLFGISRHDLFDELQKVPQDDKHFYLIKETWVPLPDWVRPDKYSVRQLQEIPPKFELLEVQAQ